MLFLTFDDIFWPWYYPFRKYEVKSFILTLNLYTFYKNQILTLCDLLSYALETKIFFYIIKATYLTSIHKGFEVRPASAGKHDFYNKVFW